MIWPMLGLALCATFVQGFSADTYMHKAAYKHQFTKAVGGEPEAPEFWAKSAQDSLSEKLKSDRRLGEAKNVIMFLGDGWGVSTMTLARILKGQEVDKVGFGEEGQLHVDTFEFSGMSKTFCVDAQVADSACSTTAYLGGVKTNTGTIGVTSDVQLGNCTAQKIPANQVSNILAWAQAAGKSTGIVTTTRVTHASPAGAYAHTSHRDWESDIDIPLDGKDCEDIASQLILREPGKNINVILGGGRRKFLPFNFTDSESQNGEREDGKNLIDIWKSKNEPNVNATYVETVDDLKNVDAAKADYLLGLFAPSHLAYFHEQAPDQDPTLTEMTEKAIEILSKNPKGFFLFVEGGRIDHAHHDNEALRSIWEAVEFDRAIKKGDEMTSDDDTLIVVTADHSHAFSFPGYNVRGENITNIAGYGDDTLPYATMSYANGPGNRTFDDGLRHNISNDPIHTLDYKQVPLVPLDSETHGGEDVMIFARGPFAHLFTGVHQQSYIPHAMGYASCLGPGLTYCSDNKSNSANYAISNISLSALIIISIVSYFCR
ncbi:unnamed protein product [Orchesella dallaii]|uniref:alkaline phosphatase n=1 Tax=Orchesella dallaii TaxID=48710 RepID=A0ABP1RRW3_9HEXA